MLPLMFAPIVSSAAPPPPPAYAFEREAPATNKDRRTTREFALRSRWLSVPHRLIDNYYYRGTETGWAYIEGRPALTAHALGVEASLVDGRHQGVFYLEYVDATFDAGYFDDVDEGTPDHLDGIFLEPGPWLGLAVFGVDYLHVIPLLKPEHTRSSVGISFSLGVGAGVGVVTGELSTWDADDVGNPAYKRYLDGTERDQAMDLPPVVPMLDLLGKLSFSLGERANVYVDGGLHTALYWGAGAGVSF